MPLWKDAVGGQPSWLLGEDGGVGLGNNGVKNDKDINGVDLVDGNEIARADDQAGIGWRVWHSKENGKKIGEGRGWWEILATQDVDGGHVDMGGPVATQTEAITLTNLADEIPLTITLSAVDPDGSDVTYELVGAPINCDVTITGNQAEVTSIDVTTTGTTTRFDWKATAGGLDSATITVDIALP